MDSELRSSRDNIQLVSSFINLERRRLKTGCYEDCLDALHAISFRIEILSFLDNFLLSENSKENVHASVFMDAITSFLMDHYSVDERDRTINVFGTLKPKQCRDLSLILNELMIPWNRVTRSGTNTSMAITVSRERDIISVMLNLSPKPPSDREINMMLVLDLLKQHDGHISSQSSSEENDWCVEFPLR